MLGMQSFTPSERRALVLAKGYEYNRRKLQFGYLVWPRPLTPALKETGLFKQFHTVATWLESQGFTVAWRAAHWRGYVAYCFEALKPRLLQPGQLKNRRLLEQYIRSQPFQGRPREESISWEELRGIYSRVLHTCVLDDRRLMRLLGLEEVPRRCPPRSANRATENHRRNA
jgi:hypothetical protein